ncbi:MAG: insulinase family protein [Clostridia bacterium]|nr:insulinase family protein [Clostridia bacterium]
MDYIKKINDKLTVIVSEGDALSASFAIMVGTGSVNENDKTNGLSHFIEHMNFKGTNEMSAFDISNALEMCGANFNAYTGADVTCYYAQTLSENLEKAFSVFSSAVFKSIYPSAELEKEKNVILEEINMSLDSPEDVCYDLAALSYFGSNGYGRTILGSSENVKSFTKSDILNYLSKYYVAENICIAFTGNVSVDSCLELVSNYVVPYVSFEAKAKEEERNLINLKQNLFKDKDIEQAHFCLTFSSPNYLDKNRIASEIATTILGGGMSSRLFQKVREELGLSYSVYATSSRFKDVGTTSIYAGVNPTSVDDAYNAILEVVSNLVKSGISDDEFIKVKNQIKSSTVFSLERPMSKAQLFSKYYINTGKLYSVNERLAHLDLVSKSDVIDALSYFDVNNMSTAIVGKNVKPLK